MDYFTLFIYLIFVIKLGFILMALTHLHLKMKGQENSSLDKNIVYWKEKFEFVFVFLMAILLLYLFNPRKSSVVVTGETKTVIFLFGIVLLITAKWSEFFHESLWFKRLQKIIGKNN